MDGIGVDAVCKVGTDGTGFGFFRIGSAHQLAVFENGIFAFQHLQHDGARDHEINQVFEERTLFVNAVELFCL